jgi:hypothetical protein
VEGPDLQFRKLVVGHWHVRRPEVHRAARQLGNSAAGTDRLIIDLDVGMQFMEFLEPLLVDGRGKGSARGVDLLRHRDGGAPHQQASQGQSYSLHICSHHNLLTRKLQFS